MFLSEKCLKCSIKSQSDIFRLFSKGIAAFFMKKFGNQDKKPSRYSQPESNDGKRPLSAVSVPITDDPDVTSSTVHGAAVFPGSTGFYIFITKFSQFHAQNFASHFFRR